MELFHLFHCKVWVELYQEGSETQKYGVLLSPYFIGVLKRKGVIYEVEDNV